jgi:hypothetical protein
VTAKQTQAAKRNIKKAQQAAKRKRTIAKLPRSTRRGLGQQAARARQRDGKAGRALEDRKPAAALRGGQEEADPRPLEDGQVGPDQGDPQGGLNSAER